MRKTPFLAQVAKHYADCEQLADMAFVLPNRRSSQQLERYLKALLKRTTLMPRMMKMDDLVDHIVRDSKVIASPIEALFLAYQSYKEKLGDSAGEFDKFAFWGQLIVNDFNDIDMCMVDAKQLYINLRDLKDIKANYIDEDVQEAIKRILSIHIDKQHGSEEMWRNGASAVAGEQEKEIQKKYLTLWDKLAEIYEDFEQRLSGNNLTTQGKRYRQAVEELRNTSAEELGFSRIVLVGHSMLTKSEHALFKALNDKGISDFWWDNAFTAASSVNNPGYTAINALAQEFKSPVEIEQITEFPAVTLQSIPSSIGMAKCAFEGIEEVSSTTSIILPDETLLEPILNSLPAQLFGTEGIDKKINITMGYSLRRSNIATLMRLVTVAHKHATRSGDRWMYYREDVRDILSHPIIKLAYTNEVLAISNLIESQNEYNIPESTFESYEPFKLLFTTLNNSQLNDKEQVKKFINNLEKFCRGLYDKIEQKVDKKHDQETENSRPDDSHRVSLQRAFIDQYIGALNQLRLAIDHVGLPVQGVTVFHLFDRLSATALIPFGGKSGEGIQVMGMLETRCLDFEDVRILSATEGTLPQNSIRQTLIPDRFRAAFGMPCIESEDATQVYNFYRLISRAGKVTLYHDSSSNNEPSRYVEQLQKVYAQDVEIVKRTANVTNMTQLEIQIDNDDFKKAIKKKYTEGELGRNADNKKKTPCLSASSINEFINCPLKFFFHHIKGLSDDNDASDFMDSAQFGTIVHDTLQDLYYPDVENRQREFGKEDIENFIKNHLKDRLTFNINKTFVRLPEEQCATHPLSGQAFILYETLETYVKRALEKDMEVIGDGKLEVLECEESHELKLKLSDDVTINFTFKIDRVDRIGSTVRIIDYKTGADVTRFRNIEDLFDRDKKDRRAKAILQLLLYTVAYMRHKGENLRELGVETIEPHIYKLREMAESGVKRGDKRNCLQVAFNVSDFENNQLIKDFLGLMASTIEKLWTGSIAQSEVADYPCKYCHYTDFCRR
ncbi:MAG: PD-(D/E)XK nuclease family protein [Muribaculaceae bacterium]|nr:PD-(D/E)XK nuclease family protein [Muribaculaceae bacterium]